MTKQERDELRGLCAGSTPGPWYARFGVVETTEEYRDIKVGERTMNLPCSTIIAGEVNQHERLGMRTEDAALTAAARNALPALLDALDAAEAVVEAAQSWSLCSCPEHRLMLARALDAYELVTR